MNEHDDGLTLAEQRMRDLLRSVAPPEADPAFRERLRKAFVTGTIEPPVVVAEPPATPEPPVAAEAPAAAPPVEARPRPVRPDVRAPWAGLPWVRWGLAFASAVVMFFVVVALNQGPTWELRSISGQGVAVIDGLPVSLDHRDEIARMIRPGSRVRVPDGADVMLASAGTMALDLTPGTDAVIPATPGRWFGRSVNSEVRSGILRITTGTRFHGAKLMVQTPAADVRVTGTTLAVICDPEGTCVCVLEGTVEVGAHGGPRADVPQGRRRFVYLDERAPDNDVIRPKEAVMLTDFRAAQRGFLGGR